MNMKNQFLEAFRYFVSLCKNDLELLSQVDYLALLGSVASREAISNYSDLDILLVLRSDSTGAVPFKTLAKIRNNVEIVSKRFPVKVSVLSHTTFDFNEYVDIEYLTHYALGRVVIGGEAKFKALFENVIARKGGEKERREAVYKSMMHGRFNLLRKYASWNPINTSDYQSAMVKLMVDGVLEMCDWALNYRGVFELSKKSMVRRFLREYKLPELANIPKETLAIRGTWSKGSVKNVPDNYLMNAIEFIQNIVRVIHEDYKSK